MSRRKVLADLADGIRGLRTKRTAHAIEISLRLLVAAWNAASFGERAMSLANSLTFDDAGASRRFAVAALVLDHALRALLRRRCTYAANTGGGGHVRAVDGFFRDIIG